MPSLKEIQGPLAALDRPCPFARMTAVVLARDGLARVGPATHRRFFEFVLFLT